MNNLTAWLHWKKLEREKGSLDADELAFLSDIEAALAVVEAARIASSWDEVDKAIQAYDESVKSENIRNANRQDESRQGFSQKGGGE